MLAILAGAGVEAPKPIPGFALQAAIVYRAEVAAAVFIAAYLGLFSLAPALHNRGFTEIGAAGVSARYLGRPEAKEAVTFREAIHVAFRQEAVDKKYQDRSDLAMSTRVQDGTSKTETEDAEKWAARHFDEVERMFDREIRFRERAAYWRAVADMQEGRPLRP